MRRAPRREVSPARERRRGILRRALFVVGCWVFAGGVGLLAGAIVMAWSVVGSPRPRTLLRLSAVAMALAPVAWILGNLQRWGELGPRLVTGNPAPSVLVVASLVLLLVGSWSEGDEVAPGG